MANKFNIAMAITIYYFQIDFIDKCILMARINRVDAHESSILISDHCSFGNVKAIRRFDRNISQS